MSQSFFLAFFQSAWYTLDISYRSHSGFGLTIYFFSRDRDCFCLGIPNDYNFMFRGGEAIECLIVFCAASKHDMEEKR